jgi:hypothetical protein
MPTHSTAKEEVKDIIREWLEATMDFPSLISGEELITPELVDSIYLQFLSAYRVHIDQTTTDETYKDLSEDDLFAIGVDLAKQAFYREIEVTPEARGVVSDLLRKTEYLVDKVLFKNDPVKAWNAMVDSMEGPPAVRSKLKRPETRNRAIRYWENVATDPSAGNELRGMPPYDFYEQFILPNIDVHGNLSLPQDRKVKQQLIKALEVSGYVIPTTPEGFQLFMQGVDAATSSISARLFVAGSIQDPEDIVPIDATPYIDQAIVSFPTPEELMAPPLEGQFLSAILASGRLAPTDPEQLDEWMKLVRRGARTVAQRFAVAEAGGEEVDLDSFLEQSVGEFPTDEQFAAQGFTPSGIRADAFAPFPPGMDIASQFAETAAETDTEHDARIAKGAIAYAAFLEETGVEDIDEEEAGRRLRELEAQIAAAEQRAGDRGLSDEERAEAKKEAARLRKFYERFVAPPAQQTLTPEQQAEEEKKAKFNIQIQQAMGVREAQGDQESAREIFDLLTGTPFEPLASITPMRVQSAQDLSEPMAELKTFFTGLVADETSLREAKEGYQERLQGLMDIPSKRARTFSAIESEGFEAAAKQQQSMFTQRSEALTERRQSLEQLRTTLEEEATRRRRESMAAIPRRTTVV